tara:strand:- start:267 stop:404 length:138 start_codon:yes stop_codon:yes gene_type:complete
MSLQVARIPLMTWQILYEAQNIYRSLLPKKKFIIFVLATAIFALI